MKIYAQASTLSKLLPLVLSVLFLSCQNEPDHKAEIEKVKVDVDVKRFDREFAKASPRDLPELKQDYPFLFPPQTPDSVWVHKMDDSLQNELEVAVQNKFPDFSNQQEKLKSLLQHLKFYLPDFAPPREIVTLVSQVDYRNKVIASDSLLLVSLDNYLGPDHEFYKGVQNFIRQNFKPDQIVQDAARAYGEKNIPESKSRTLIGQMIFYGKLLYLKDRVLPESTDAAKIGYKTEEMQWAEANEYQIWKYFVDRELLYSTDPELQKDFLDPAPFTKFGLKLDNESAPRLGRFIGWQIVRAFAERNDGVLLSKLLTLKPEKIFKQSNYKPDKPS